MGNTATDSLDVHVTKPEPSVDETGTERLMVVAVLTLALVFIGLALFYIFRWSRDRTGG